MNWFAKLMILIGSVLAFLIGMSAGKWD